MSTHNIGFITIFHLQIVILQPLKSQYMIIINTIIHTFASHRYTEDNVPTHPCLQLVSNCEQIL